MLLLRKLNVNNTIEQRMDSKRLEIFVCVTYTLLFVLCMVRMQQIIKQSLVKNRRDLIKL